MASGTAVILGKKDQVSNHEMSITRQDANNQAHTNVLWLKVSDKDSNGLRTDAFGTGAGVVAYAPGGQGIRAFSDTGTGVYGEALTGGVAGVVGRGTPDREGEGGTATVGVIGDGTYAGVWGFSEIGAGVQGEAEGGGTGVYGYSKKGAGVMGDCGKKSGYAGAFFANVLITGDLTVQGAKSAAVPFPDKSIRRLYALESPESWFEDFGKGQLECGTAEIAIDADFGAVVDLSDYHVFLTEYGGHNDLSVAEHTPAGFRVEARDATSTARFSWRVVAKRKDIRGKRLEAVTVPPEPTLPAVPNIPTTD